MASFFSFFPPAEPVHRLLSQGSQGTKDTFPRDTRLQAYDNSVAKCSVWMFVSGRCPFKLLKNKMDKNTCTPFSHASVFPLKLQGGNTHVRNESSCCTFQTILISMDVSTFSFWWKEPGKKGKSKDAFSKQLVYSVLLQPHSTEVCIFCPRASVLSCTFWAFSGSLLRDTFH